MEPPDQLFGLLFTPVFYVLVRWFAARRTSIESKTDDLQLQ
jgi:hypothetical protein